jgi:CTP synthase
VVGKYIELHDAYKSIYESLAHAGIASGVNVQIRKVQAEDILEEGLDLLEGAHGLLIPGGFGERGLEGKIRAIQWAREGGVPFFGICLGMQCATVEFARNVLGLDRAHTIEHSPDTPHPVIALMEDQAGVDKGGTMRLGAYACDLREGSRVRALYGTDAVRERHRHRFEFNNAYREQFEENGMKVAGVNPERDLVEIVELPDHPFFVGVQFHPEFKSRPLQPHPIFRGFVAAAVQRARGGGRSTSVVAPRALA